MSDLFATNAARPRVLRRESREFVAWGELGRKALLTPKPFRSLEVVVARFEPGGSTGDEPYTHGDSEELFVVLEGRCTCSSALSPRARRRRQRPLPELHAAPRLEPGDETAEAMFVISPPSY